MLGSQNASYKYLCKLYYLCEFMSWGFFFLSRCRVVAYEVMNWHFDTSLVELKRIFFFSALESEFLKFPFESPLPSYVELEIKAWPSATNGRPLSYAAQQINFEIRQHCTLHTSLRTLGLGLSRLLLSPVFTFFKIGFLFIQRLCHVETIK